MLLRYSKCSIKCYICLVLCYNCNMIDSTPVRNDIREQLRVSLYAKRISVTDLAKELGMSRTNLSRMLNGQLDGKFDVWEQIAAKVGLRFALEDDVSERGR